MKRPLNLYERRAVGDLMAAFFIPFEKALHISQTIGKDLNIQNQTLFPFCQLLKSFM